MYGEKKPWFDKIVEGVFFFCFSMLTLILFLGVGFILHRINYDPVRVEKERVYMAACQSMSGVYVHSNGKNMCFKEGNMIQIDE